MAKLTLLKLVKIIKSNSELIDLFRYNSFTKEIEFMRDPPFEKEGTNLSDKDIIKLKYYLSYVNNEIDPNTNLIEEALVIVASEKTYHPVKKYLNGLKWDGVERLETWLVDLLGVDNNQYVRDISRKILCAAVKRIYEPGCKFDYMLIVEGDQGIGKSTFFNILGGEWYLDTQLNTSESKKEIVDVMQTAWIIEIADLAGFRKHEIENLRSFISRNIDKVRLSYARRSEYFPRQNIFIGTHNPSGNNEYLKDDTGNRRFWPVVATKIDIEKAKELRDQLWAEAVVKYKDEILYLNNQESIGILKELHREREPYDFFDRKIEEFINGKNIVNSEEIIRSVFGRNIEAINPRELIAIKTKVGICLKNNGWKKGENEKRGWYFKEGYQFIDIKEEDKQVGWSE